MSKDRIRIVEPFGNGQYNRELRRGQTGEEAFRDLKIHHPNANAQAVRAANPRAVDRRDGVFIDGELESARVEGDRNGIPLVKKDLILTTEDGSRDLMIPSPVAGYAEFMHDKTNGIRLWSGKPGDPSRELVGEVLHGAKGSSPFKEGEYVAYGAPLVRQSNAGTKGVHAHIEVEPAQFRTYLGDVLNDRITAHVGHGVRGQANHGSPAPAMADGVLKLGETNDDAIKQLQDRLNLLGVTDARGLPLVADRDFGQRTEEAVKIFQRAQGIEDDGKVGKITLDALTKAEAARRDQPEAAKTVQHTGAEPARSALLSDPGHKDHAMYRQAVDGLEKLGGFGSQQDIERAAATLTHDARVGGLGRIDHVVSNGNGLFAVQGGLNDPGHQRAYVDRQQAIGQSVEQSSQLIKQDVPEVPAQQPQQQTHSPHSR